MGKKKTKARRQESTKDLPADSAADTAEVDINEEESESQVPAAGSEGAETQLPPDVLENRVPASTNASDLVAETTTQQQSIPSSDTPSDATDNATTKEAEILESATDSNKVDGVEGAEAKVDHVQPGSHVEATVEDDGVNVNTVAGVDDQPTSQASESAPSVDHAAPSSPRLSFSIEKEEPLSPIPPVAFAVSAGAALLLPATTPGKSLQRIPSIHTNRLSSSSSDLIGDRAENSSGIRPEVSSPEAPITSSEASEPVASEQKEEVATAAATNEEAPTEVNSSIVPTEAESNTPQQQVENSHVTEEVVKNINEAVEVENPLQQAPSPNDSEPTEQEEDEESSIAKPEPIRDYVHTAPNAQATFLESPFGFLFCGCY